MAVVSFFSNIKDIMNNYFVKKLKKSGYEYQNNKRYPFANYQ
jgi:hypothetical protein